MGDLHSIAYSSNFTPLIGWEFQNLGVFNTDMSHFMMGSCTPTCFDSDNSTGYLEDALFEFSSKRRRLLLFSDHQTNYSTSPIDQSRWKENLNEIYEENLGYLNQINHTDSVSGNLMDRTAFERISVDSSSSSLNSKASLNIGSISETLDSVAGGGDEEWKKIRKKAMTRVVYPFAVVKPGGREGEMTLNDINERILKPPTRPVRHPVGDFACRRMVSPNGPGLSGKAVVALTTLQTQGRGTITIIRTKG